MKYICSICGYIYDEEKEGAAFSQLPETWVCPLCKAPKSAFQPEAPKEAGKMPVSTVEADDELQELSAGELSALLSNLARGCEKQYKEKEAALFRELADYFEGLAPAVGDCEVGTLAERVMENLSRQYPDLEAAAEANQDRGALRAYTWSLKVTRMQQAILSQYQQQGEAFLAHTNVWVCTVCGFIYVGDNPPALCPVCKVPDWKFEKITGGMPA